MNLHVLIRSNTRGSLSNQDPFGCSTTIQGLRAILMICRKHAMFPAMMFASCVGTSHGDPIAPYKWRKCCDELKKMKRLQGGPHMTKAKVMRRNPFKSKVWKPSREDKSSFAPPLKISYLAARQCCFTKASMTFPEAENTSRQDKSVGPGLKSNKKYEKIRLVNTNNNLIT